MDICIISKTLGIGITSMCGINGGLYLNGKGAKAMAG